MEGLLSSEFFSEQVFAVLRAWAIVIPLLLLLLLIAWNARGIWKD
jgi:hypothetical protein